MVAILKADLFRKVSLRLPNGAVLRSKKTFEKGTFWRTYYYVHPHLPKIRSPLVSGFSSHSNMHLGVIDIDELPPGFSSFDQVVEALLDLPGIMACRSHSGRAKGFFVFKWATHYPDAKQVVARLKSILPSTLANSFDEKGVSRFFLSTEVAECLKDLSSASFFDWSDAGAGTRDSNIVSDSPNIIESLDFSYHLSDETNIPESFELFINRKGKGWESRSKFCQIILAMFGLANKEGFSLPQKSIGDQIGVSNGAVGVWLKWFMEKGLLQKVSNSYIVGLKAIRYTAHGDLLNAIVERKQQTKYAITLPKQLPGDGEFYSYLLSLSKKLPNWLDYKTVVASIPGIQYKNRYKMAENIFQHDRKKERNK